MGPTIRIKDRYFNYDNIVEIDFEIRQGKVGVQYIYDATFYIVNFLTTDRTIASIKLETLEEWENAKRKLEIGIINNYPFIQLTEDGKEE